VGTHADSEGKVRFVELRVVRREGKSNVPKTYRRHVNKVMLLIPEQAPPSDDEPRPEADSVTSL
jgi:hypothetical protein